MVGASARKISLLVLFGTLVWLAVVNGCKSLDKEGDSENKNWENKESTLNNTTVSESKNERESYHPSLTDITKVYGAVMEDFPDNPNSERVFALLVDAYRTGEEETQETICQKIMVDHLNDEIGLFALSRLGKLQRSEAENEEEIGRFYESLAEEYPDTSIGAMAMDDFLSISMGEDISHLMMVCLSVQKKFPGTKVARTAKFRLADVYIEMKEYRQAQQLCEELLREYSERDQRVTIARKLVEIHSKLGQAISIDEILTSLPEKSEKVGEVAKEILPDEVDLSLILSNLARYKPPAEEPGEENGDTNEDPVEILKIECRRLKDELREESDESIYQYILNHHQNDQLRAAAAEQILYLMKEEKNTEELIQTSKILLGRHNSILIRSAILDTLLDFFSGGVEEMLVVKFFRQIAAGEASRELVALAKVKLGVFYYKLQCFKQAVAYYKAGIREKPVLAWMIEAPQKLASSYLRLGEPDLAKEVVFVYSDTAQESELVYETIAQQYLAEYKVEGALNVYQEFINRYFPETPVEKTFADEETLLSITMYKISALKSEQGTADEEERVMALYWQAGNDIEQLEKVILLYPDSFEAAKAWHKIGNLLHKQGKQEDALAAYKKVIEHYPFYDCPPLDKSIMTLEKELLEEELTAVLQEARSRGEEALIYAIINYPTAAEDKYGEASALYEQVITRSPSGELAQTAEHERTILSHQLKAAQEEKQ